MYEGDKQDLNSFRSGRLLLIICAILGFFVWKWFHIGTFIFSLLTLEAYADVKQNEAARK